MTQPSTQVDFDKNPPMPLTEYEQTVKRVNVGYDLTFLLTECFLRALGKSDLNLLVIGAGGGAEIEPRSSASSHTIGGGRSLAWIHRNRCWRKPRPRWLRSIWEIV
jgi:hypothetical protein